MLNRRHSAATAVAAVSARFGRDVELCLEQVAGIVRSASSRGADLVVFPESTLGGYVYEPAAEGAKVSVAPPPALTREYALERLAHIAGSTVICVGYTEAAPGGPYSSAICLNGDGILGHHRKVHVPPGERAAFAAGDDFEAFDTPVGRVGMLVCYDKVFPEAARRLTLDGAEIIASLAAWPVCRLRPSNRVRRDREVQHFNLLDQARAVENQVVWVSANQCGRLGRLRFPGQAKVVCPDGRILAGTGSRSGLALARIDARDAVRSARLELSHLADRRPPAYTTAIA